MRRCHQIIRCTLDVIFQTEYKKMTTDEKIRGEKLHCDVNREAAKSLEKQITIIRKN